LAQPGRRRTQTVKMTRYPRRLTLIRYVFGGKGMALKGESGA